MSTLRTDTLQTTDSSFTIAVDEIAAIANLFPINKSVNSVAALRTSSKLLNSYISTLGYYTPGDGGGATYYYDSTDVVSADNGGSVIVGADGGRWKNTNKEVDTRQWGAKGDGVTDDTSRIQAAVTYCTATTRAIPLVVSGKVRLTAPINIDRLVDTSQNEFRVVANGTDSGFFSDGNIEMFTSSLPMGVDPISEFVTFENLTFTSSVATSQPRVLSKKFLRIKFLNCYFKNVKCMISDTYVQTMYFSNCNIRTWEGHWLLASHGFDIDMNGCIAEHGNGYVLHLINGCYSVRVRGSLVEGSGGGAILTGNAKQLTIDGCYFELNTLPSLEFAAGLPNESISVINCFFGSSAANIANPAFFEINWGSTKHAYSSGNHHLDGRLHGNAGLPAGFPSVQGMDSLGDSAAITLYQQPIFVNQARGVWTPATSVGAPTVAFANFSRENVTSARVSFRMLMPVSASTANVLVTNLPYSSSETIFGGAVALTDQVGEVYFIGGSGSGTGAGPSSFAICKNKQGLPYTYTELSGKLVSGFVEYSI